jgi:hypothetical protein
MKAQKNNLKLAVMSVGFLFLFSCTGDVNGGSAFLNSSFLNKAVEEIGASVKQDKNDAEANKIIQGAVIPFFFGTVEATLN